MEMICSLSLIIYALLAKIWGLHIHSFIHTHQNTILVCRIKWPTCCWLIPFPADTTFQLWATLHMYHQIFGSLDGPKHIMNLNYKVLLIYHKAAEEWDCMSSPYVHSSAHMQTWLHFTSLLWVLVSPTIAPIMNTNPVPRLLYLVMVLSYILS